MARRTNLVSVYLSDEEKEALDYICESGISRGNAIRLMIMAVKNDLLYISAENASKFNELYEKYSRQ